jgi:hypothetical protein
MAFKPREIAVTITQQKTSQQSKLLPNNLACNSFNRYIDVQISLYATVIKSIEKGTPFNREAWVYYYNTKNPDTPTSSITAYRSMKKFERLGFIERKDCHNYVLTERGRIVALSFKKTLMMINRWLKMGQKEAVENYFLTYASEQLKGQLKGFFDCSYIEQTKNRITNISSRLYGSFVDHVTMTPEERMLKNIKKRNLGIEKHEIEQLFKLIRHNVGFIKDPKWFEVFNALLQTANKWLQTCKTLWTDGADYFINMWLKMGQKAFTKPEQLNEILNRLLNNNREEWEYDSLAYSIE